MNRGKTIKETITHYIKDIVITIGVGIGILLILRFGMFFGQQETLKETGRNEGSILENLDEGKSAQEEDAVHVEQEDLIMKAVKPIPTIEPIDRVQ